jgi:hypothetical protein
MTVRQVLVQAGLAVAALVTAYFTWQRGPELAPDEAFALDIAKNDLSSARFDDEEKHTWVELGRSSDENGSFITVRLGPQDKPGSKPKAPDKHKAPDKTGAKTPAETGAKTPGETDAKTPDEAEAKTPVRLVRGSAAAEKLFASFTPLRANRSLGVLAPQKLKELGLDAPKQRITLTLRSGKRVFAIVPAPPGGTLPYLRDEASGQVYVVARSFLSDFQTASSLLVERKAHGFRIEDADRIAITRGNVKREYVVVRSDHGVQMAPANAPDKPDAGFKTWHDKVFSLWPVEVLGQGEVPAEGTPEVALRLNYSMRGSRLGWLEIGKVPAVASSAEAGKDVLFARDERSLGWVKLGTSAQNVLTDAQSLIK